MMRMSRSIICPQLRYRKNRSDTCDFGLKSGMKWLTTTEHYYLILVDNRCYGVLRMVFNTVVGLNNSNLVFFVVSIIQHCGLGLVDASSSLICIWHGMQC